MCFCYITVICVDVKSKQCFNFVTDAINYRTVLGIMKRDVLFLCAGIGCKNECHTRILRFSVSAIEMMWEGLDQIRVVVQLDLLLDNTSFSLIRPIGNSN